MKKYIIVLPTLITCIRILFLPCIVLLFLHNNYYFAGILLFFSLFSDIADGWIARKYNAVTKLGTLLDPLADKLFTVCCYFLICISNAQYQLIPLWYFGAIVIKELALIVGVALTWCRSQQKTVVHATWHGKVAMALHGGIIAVAFLYYAHYVSYCFAHCVIIILIAPALVISYWALVHYILIFLRRES